MLTVDYDRFGLRAGDRLLDLGCGFGRHTYEALVRGADVVSCDMALPELENIRNTAPMLVDDGLFDGQLLRTQVQGDGTRLPFQHVLGNLLAVARERPIVIQSLFLTWQGEQHPW